MATPAEEQYQNLKKQYAGSILLFRMGDFYEVFDEDAYTLSKAIGLTLTSRSKGENKRPMAGIPHHALPQYLGKIVKLGFKVAIAEQMEDPKATKGVVKRDVVKVVTSSTLIDERNLDETQSSYIVSIMLEENIYSVCFLDLSTGEFQVTEFKKSIFVTSEIISLVRSLYAKELILDEQIKGDFESLNDIPKKLIDKYSKDFTLNYKRLLELFGVSSLKGFGIEENRTSIIAAGVIIDYLSKEQKWDLSHVRKIIILKRSNYMSLDPSTVRNLELIYPLHQESALSLVKVMDHTKTPMGKRLIRKTIVMPFVDKQMIIDRYKTVSLLVEDKSSLDSLRNLLNSVFDIERISARIGLRTVNPRDFLALKESLIQIKSLESFSNINQLKSLSRFSNSISEMIHKIDSHIDENATIDIANGYIFKKEMNSEIDELRNIRGGGHDVLAKMQEEEIQKTGITNLKIRFNNVFGFYIEVTKSYLEKVPNNYIRKQTLVNAERFITEELKQMEEKILTAEQKLIELEKRLFLEFREEFLDYLDDLQQISTITAEIDLLSTFAFNAISNNYVLPEITEKETYLKIENGRHPVVERSKIEEFIPNDVNLSQNEFIIILTGPNMSGKSTYIRQIALLTLMAQMGSFVPASKFKYSIVDRVFTRIGASDNLSASESTFMVEMNETANILNNATSSSLIILDEVGRGTSTFDGVAIAYSVVKYIYEKLKARTLFATHYNELTKLSDKFEKIKNYKVSIDESNGDVVFLHKIVEGASEKSFGVHVAKLAGLPKDVVNTAEEILKDFETKNNKVGKVVKKQKMSERMKPHIPQITLGI